MYHKTNVHYRSKLKNPLFYDKTNVHYRSKGMNPLFYDNTNVHYRIRGKDALVGPAWASSLLGSTGRP